MVIKRKRKKRRKRRKRIARTLKTGGLVAVETIEEQRKKFPKELLDAFIAVKNSKWENEELYEEYLIESRRFLGEEKSKDRIESGTLVVLLTRATLDIYDGKKTEKEKDEEN